MRNRRNHTSGVNHDLNNHNSQSIDKGPQSDVVGCVKLLQYYSSAYNKWMLVEFHKQSRFWISKERSNIAKASASVNAPPRLVAQLLSNPIYNPEWDIGLQALEIISTDKKNNVTKLYATYNSNVCMTWPRDYCIQQFTHKSPNGTWYIAMRSYEDHFQPPITGVIRSKILPGSGFCIQPALSEAGKCNVTLVGNYDFTGGWPEVVFQPWLRMMLMSKMKRILSIRNFASNYLTFKGTSASAIKTPPVKRRTIALGDNNKLRSQSPGRTRPKSVHKIVMKDNNTNSLPVAQSSGANEKAEEDDFVVVNNSVEPFRERINEALKKIKKLSQVSSGEDGWRESQSGGVTILKREEKDGLASALGKGRIPAPASFLRTYIRDIEIRSEWDTMFKEGRIVKQLDDSTFIAHETYNSVWPTSPRDILYLGTYELDKSGTYYMCAFSVEDGEVPEQKDSVRVNLLVGGWVLKPCKEDPNVTDCTYITCINLGGTLPAFVKSQVIHNQPMVIATLRKVVEKKYKDTFEAETVDTVVFPPTLLHSGAPAQSSHITNTLDDFTSSVLSEDEEFPSSYSPFTPDERSSKRPRSVSALYSSENESESMSTRRSSLGASSIQFPPLHFAYAPDNQYFDIIRESMDQLLDAAKTNKKSSGWRNFELKNDVLITRRKTKGTPFFCQKGIGEIGADVETIKNAIISFENQSSWDPLLKQSSIIESISDQCKVIHAIYETKVCVIKQSRDFCYVTYWRRDKKGNVFIVGRSIQHDKCPIDPSRIRGEVIGSGWIIEPKNQADGAIGESKVTYVTQVDPKEVPVPIVNLIAERQPLNIASLRRKITGSRNVVKAGVL